MMHLLKSGHKGFNSSIFSGSLPLLLSIYALLFLSSVCSAIPVDGTGLVKESLDQDSISTSKLQTRTHRPEEYVPSDTDPRVNDRRFAPPDSASVLEKRTEVKSTYQMPGVMACASQMELFKKMTNVNYDLPWVFYTGYPMENTHAIAWAAKHFHEKANPSKEDYKFIAWGRTFLNSWANAVQASMIRGMKASTPPFPLKVQLLFADRFLKNVARAYSREARGDIYLVVSSNINPENSVQGWNINTAWGGWEFPTLTRNKAVNNIYRVDPDKDTAPKLIWKKGQEPVGKPRGNMLPLYPAFDTKTEEAIGLN